MSTYQVKLIRPGRERDYRDYWVNGLSTNQAGDELDSNQVGFTEIVEAPNRLRAEAVARELYPECTVDTQATQRIG